MVYVPSYTNMCDVGNIVKYFGVKETVRAVCVHSLAIFLYLTCSLHFPNFGLAKHVDEQYKDISSILSWLLWTLLIWTVFSFHYFVTGGRIKFASPTRWELRASGFCMILSPRTHKMVSFFALLSSCLAAFQCLLLDFLMRKFISSTSFNHDVLYKSFFLKVHAVFCILMTSYSIFRIIYDPKILNERKNYLKNRSEEKKRDVVISVSAEGWPTVSDGPQECAICTVKAANRQLRCGHTICCCCISQISRSKSCVTCPFCRMEVFNARRLIIEPEKTTVPLIHCGDCGCKDEENTSEEQSETIDNRRRESGDSHERDGASAVLLSIPEVVPAMGI
ncbi:hypothetical protein PFISCL1PPCAC_23838 [Pristionchus fissidentatus]|uniref:RING-type domain-containing protein n=1 Tax=Pristionchus fissidentatus TaxID=1538716 RepID=A0AAV5WNJ5_9BILA|nr:hypothetical protein PFISCL1PPCAC_23838 [Pristionchus fissidentatus]